MRRNRSVAGFPRKIPSSTRSAARLRSPSAERCEFPGLDAPPLLGLPDRWRARRPQNPIETRDRQGNPISRCDPSYVARGIGVAGSDPNRAGGGLSRLDQRARRCACDPFRFSRAGLVVSSPRGACSPPDRRNSNDTWERFCFRPSTAMVYSDGRGNVRRTRCDLATT